MGLSAPGPGPTKAHASEKEEITASLGESDLCCVSEWVKQLVCCWAAYGTPSDLGLDTATCRKDSLPPPHPRLALVGLSGHTTPNIPLNCLCAALISVLGFAPPEPQLGCERTEGRDVLPIPTQPGSKELPRGRARAPGRGGWKARPCVLLPEDL